MTLSLSVLFLPPLNSSAISWCSGKGPNSLARGHSAQWSRLPPRARFSSRIRQASHAMPAGSPFTSLCDESRSRPGPCVDSTPQCSPGPSALPQLRSTVQCRLRDSHMSARVFGIPRLGLSGHHGNEVRSFCHAIVTSPYHTLRLREKGVAPASPHHDKGISRSRMLGFEFQLGHLPSV